jgi:hypothetical protein
MRRETRLSRIAQALAEGATVTEIAEREGISRTTASTIANSDQCRQLLSEFADQEHDSLRGLYYRALRVIEHAMAARKEYANKEGFIVKGGPDHYARLAATKHLRDFLNAGRPKPQHPEKTKEERRLTLPELEALLKAQPK